MAFVTMNYDSWKLVTLLTASSTTIAKWDALAFASGYVQRATSSTAEIKYVADQSVVTAGWAHTEILCVPADWVRFIGDTNSTITQALAWTKVDLTDHDTINEGATTTKVFFVEKMFGPAGDKKLQWYFVKKDA